MNAHARGNAWWAGIAALLMLGYGWAYGFRGVSDNEFYNTTVAVFNWMLRVGGLAIAAVAVLCFLGRREGLLLDVVVSGTCGLIMVACGAYWLAAGTGFGINDLLVLIFGGGFLNAARTCWLAYRASAPISAAAHAGTTPVTGAVSPRRCWGDWLSLCGRHEDRPTDAQPAQPGPPHPASIRPRCLPPDGGPPPPEGYLAALAKEDEQPPEE